MHVCRNRAENEHNGGIGLKTNEAAIQNGKGAAGLRSRMKWSTYMRRYGTLYLLLILPLIFFIVFRYAPMVYILGAFKQNNIIKPPWQVPWAKNHGFEWFIKAFSNRDFLYALRNTLTLNLLDLVIGFPAPIILALLLISNLTGRSDTQALHSAKQEKKAKH